MNDNLETIKEYYSKTERKFPLAEKNTDSTQIFDDDDGKVEFPEKVKEKRKKNFSYLTILKNKLLKRHMNMIWFTILFSI